MSCKNNAIDSYTCECKDEYLGPYNVCTGQWCCNTVFPLIYHEVLVYSANRWNIYRV